MKSGKPYIQIPAEEIPVKEQADLCVIGGSCTGVFAAVRAARLGAKVVLIEQSNKFGGVATQDLVGMWHPVYEFNGPRQIIGGLTWEMLERLEQHNGGSPFRKSTDYVGTSGNPFNTDELVLELDDLVLSEPNIRIYLCTSYTDAVLDDSGDAIEAVIAFNKSGRFAVRASRFIDASGDGLLCRDAGVPMRHGENPQPPTACCKFENWGKLGGIDLKALIERNRSEFPDLPCGYAWGTWIPHSSLFMLSGTRVLKCNCADADEITRAELESRRQIRALTDLLRKEHPEANLLLQGLPSAIGIRESLHLESLEQVHGTDLLHSRLDPEQTIGCGTYPVDIHHNDSDRIEFYHLDGTHRIYRSNQLEKSERWLPDGEILPFYRIPLKCLIPKKLTNLLAAGRMLNADPMAFGALRVMVNLNQCGEAAGVAAVMSLSENKPVQQIEVPRVRRKLAEGGSVLV